MRRLCVQLRHPNGTAYRWISRREAQELIDKGDAYIPRGTGLRGKAHRRIFEVQLRPVPEPSKSPTSNASLTFRDTETLAGAREAKASRLETLHAKQLYFRPTAFPVVYV
jgi:hypothetical protein